MPFRGSPWACWALSHGHKHAEPRVEGWPARFHAGAHPCSGTAPPLCRREPHLCVPHSPGNGRCRLSCGDKPMPVLDSGQWCWTDLFLHPPGCPGTSRVTSQQEREPYSVWPKRHLPSARCLLRSWGSPRVGLFRGALKGTSGSRCCAQGPGPSSLEGCGTRGGGQDRAECCSWGGRTEFQPSRQSCPPVWLWESH